MLRRKIAVILSMSLFFASSYVGVSSAEDEKIVQPRLKIQLKRYSGIDRYETSLILSKLLSTVGSKHVLIASGENFADALFGGTLAASLNAPILLTPKNSLPVNVEKKLVDEKIKNVTILGGISSVSESVEKTISRLGINVERIAGSDRFETAEMITKKRSEILKSGAEQTSIAYASGVSFADALSATPFIYYDDMNNLTGGVENSLIKYIPYNNQSGEVKAKYVFGGVSSVADTVVDSSRTSRFSGEDRYSTSIEIAKACEEKLKIKVNTVFLASGDTFPDALSVGPIAARHGSVVLLTEKDKLNEEVKKFLSERRITRINIVGGTSAISENVENQLKAMYEDTSIKVPEKSLPIEKMVDEDKSTDKDIAKNK